ncbi:hypothetical protein LINPERPRIM_LOCUS32673, partial [Linum perenne]
MRGGDHPCFHGRIFTLTLQDPIQGENLQSLAPIWVFLAPIS